MTIFPGLAHIAVTVSDLGVSRQWYTALFGTPPVLDEEDQSGNFHHAVFALDDGTLFGLHAHQNADASSTFDERRVGLDHVGFGCTQDSLKEWRARLEKLGIAHGGIVTAPYGSGISFRDPDNIALEFFAPPS
ncbi:VOC family protein [Rhodococcus sp. IEGM 1379]|uniref:VOC family protein n=1 Tax=Rhodococcus sp. IEGM 1379 TaxID=3047086 RepID=UPI0024B86ECE|nr:VOC family protein [Rhodococcus sp. IEGM 1379]MDI9916056.1 VOC family protein [Rhodococcus sp. IEGM 1379]